MFERNSSVLDTQQVSLFEDWIDSQRSLKNVQRHDQLKLLFDREIEGLCNV